MAIQQTHIEADWMSPIQRLPTELIHKIFCECDAVQDLLSLTSSCYRLYHAWVGADQTKILLPIIRLQYSPLRDALQLVIFMEEIENVDMDIVMRDAESRRALYDKLTTPQHPYMTRMLLRRIVKVGMVAAEWAEEYPQERWREDSDFRRVLNDRELHRLRRAIYRRWLYDLAFHNPSAMGYFQGSGLMQTRFLDQFSQREILEMAELDNVLSHWIANDVCPSDSTIRERFTEGLDEASLMFFRASICCNFPDACSKCIGLNKPTPIYVPKKILDEGWGDAAMSLHAINDILKLPPPDLLYLRNYTSRKSERLEYLHAKGPLFHLEPSSFITCMAAVPKMRWLRGCVYSRPVQHDGGIIDSLDHVYPPWTGETNDPPLAVPVVSMGSTN